MSRPPRRSIPTFKSRPQCRRPQLAPRPDNAIYELTAALNKLAAYTFPFELNEVTRTYFTNLAGQESGQTAADMRAILATPPDLAAARASPPSPASTPTSAPPAWPRASPRPRQQRPRPDRQANVNCRIFPGHSPEEIRQQLIALFADPKLTVKYVSDSYVVSDTAPDRKAMVPPAPIPEVSAPLTRITQALWPGVPVTPVMENGASDSIYFASRAFPATATRHCSGTRRRPRPRPGRAPPGRFLLKSRGLLLCLLKAVGGE